MKAWALAGLLAWVQVACWLPKETGLIMKDDIAAIKSDLTGVHKSLDEQRARETEHTQQALKKIEELSSALNEFNKSARMTDADFGAQMDRMIHDVQELRGAVEVNEHRLGETETKIEQTLAQRVEALNQDKLGGAAEAEGPATETLPKDKKQALAFAIKLARDEKPGEARTAFRTIVKQWPKEPGITDEALFRLGESYYEDKQVDAALREYIKVVDKFSQGALADDAYYKIGLCSLELGRLEDAQTFFSEIVNNQKKSPLVKSAKTKLDDVTRRIEQKKKSAPAKKGK